MLEAREEEERLQATATEIDRQTTAKEAVSRRSLGRNARLGGIAGIIAMAASNAAGKGQGIHGPRVPERLVCHFR